MDINNGIALISQYLVLIIALATYKRYRSKYMLFLCCFLLSVVIAETLGTIELLTAMKSDSRLIYQIYTFFEFNFIALMYGHLIKSKNKLRFVKNLVIIFNILYFASFFLTQEMRMYVTPIESLFIATILITYFIELLQSNKILNYKKLLPFWISVGFLVFYLPSIPFFTMINEMSDRSLVFIIAWLVVLMNLFIIFGLLCSKKEAKY